MRLSNVGSVYVSFSCPLRSVHISFNFQCLRTAMDSDEYTAGLRGFLSEKLFDWLKSDSLDGYDNLLLSASDEFESPMPRARHLELLAHAPPKDHTPAVTLSRTPRCVASSSRPFAAPRSEKEIEQATLNRVPLKTQQDTSYCVRLWSSWSTYHQAAAGVTIPLLTQLDPKELQHWLTHSYLKFKKRMVANSLPTPSTTWCVE